AATVPDARPTSAGWPRSSSAPARRAPDVTDRDLLLRRALAGRLVAIVRLRDGAALREVSEALVEGGITSLEFTLTTPGAITAIERCRARFGQAVVVGPGAVPHAPD